MKYIIAILALYAKMISTMIKHAGGPVNNQLAKAKTMAFRISVKGVGMPFLIARRANIRTIRQITKGGSTNAAIL